MKRNMVIFVLLIFIVLWTFPANAQLPYESPQKKSQRLEWWQNSRFGMFIHWGLYALAARHEWVKKNERITDNDYQKYFDHFNPDLFNPAKWAKIAKQTGMKYAVITTKHHEGFCLFDSRCTDYKVTKTPYGIPVPWETCQTFSGSWGYYRDELTWKDNKQLLALLIDTVSKGGNLLLNVGPTGRGTFDDRAVQRLDAIGEWMQYHSRSIYGCTQSPLQFKAPENTILTYNPASQRLYIHLLEWPMKTIFLEGYAGKVKYAQFLHDGSEIILKPKRKTTWMDETAFENELVAEIPITKPPVEVPVIELFLKD